MKTADQVSAMGPFRFSVWVLFSSKAEKAQVYGELRERQCLAEERRAKQLAELNELQSQLEESLRRQNADLAEIQAGLLRADDLLKQAERMMQK